MAENLFDFAVEGNDIYVVHLDRLTVGALCLC